MKDGQLNKPHGPGAERKSAYQQQVTMGHGALPPRGTKRLDRRKGHTDQKTVEPGVRGIVDFFHVGQRKAIVVSGEDSHMMDIDISADGDAEAENSQNHGNSLAEARAANQQQNQKWQHEVEMLFHAERPDMGEGLVMQVVDAEIFREGKKLPCWRQAGSFTKGGNGEIEKQTVKYAGSTRKARRI